MGEVSASYVRGMLCMIVRGRKALYPVNQKFIVKAVQSAEELERFVSSELSSIPWVEEEVKDSSSSGLKEK